LYGRLDKPTLNVEEYLHLWLKDYCKPRLAPSTIHNYQSVIKKHLIPALGKIPLNELCTIDLTVYYYKKLGVSSRKSTGRLALGTIRLHHQILNNALNHAIELRLIKHNPAWDVTLFILDNETIHSILSKPADTNYGAQGFYIPNPHGKYVRH